MYWIRGIKMLRILFILVVSAVLAGCSKSEYVVGYTGSLSRDITDISLGGRDGAILAIEEINKSGGINGRKVKLLVRDDQDIPEIAPVVDSQLIAEGAFAIIGHLNSTMTQAGLNYVNKTQTVLISPNSNSPLFVNKDDQLICMLPSGQEMVKTMLNVLINEYQTPTLAIIYNGRNVTYTIPVAQLISKIYGESGGEITGMYAYNSSSNYFDYRSVAEEAVENKPEAIALVTNAMDAAFFARHLYDLKAGAILIGGDATCNEELLEGSGVAVENMITVQAYSPELSDKKGSDFRERFRRRFGYIPSYDAMYSYTTMKLIEAALIKEPDEKWIKESILSLGDFHGLTYDIKLNEYGDNEQPYIVLQVKNGDLQTYESD